MNTDGLPAFNFIILAFELHSIQRIEQLSKTEAENNGQIVSLLKISPFSSEAWSFKDSFKSITFPQFLFNVYKAQKRQKEKKIARENEGVCEL